MPEIAPFRGIRYDVAKVGEISRVVTPPYDVISPAQRDAYHERHPYSAIRLDLGRGPTEGSDTWYLQAGRTFVEWQRDGVLRRDPAPALYLYEQEFAQGGRSVVRRGVVALVRIEPYGEGTIHPHERTFLLQRRDRLNLMRACPANLSHILAIYGGPREPIAAIQDRAMAGPPAATAVDDEGFRHRLWLLTDREAIRRIAGALRDRHAVIADGHHRYETAMAYREECLALDADPVERRRRKVYNYTTMLLVSAEDPGLVILPTHRLVRAIPQATTEALLEETARLFSVEARELPDGTGRGALAACLGEMDRRRSEGTILGLYPGGPRAYLITPAEAARAAAARAGAEASRLDVGLLHAAFFREVLRLSADQEVGQVTYTHDEGFAFRQVASGAARLALLVNSTPVEEVLAVASTGGRLPHKSTYFYPKLLTGLVFNRLDLAEEAEAV